MLLTTRRPSPSTFFSSCLACAPQKLVASACMLAEIGCWSLAASRTYYPARRTSLSFISPSSEVAPRMRLKHAFIALTCLAVQIQHADAKSFLGSGAEARLRRSTEMSVDYERLYRRMAEPQQPSRTTEVVSSSPTATASGTTAVTTESAGNTTAACENVLTALSGAIMSPTGMSVCFDVTELDTTTGIFMSMVLLYQVAPASGNWTVIDNQSLNVDIAYSGANLTSMGVASRSITDPQLAKRAITNTPADVPVLITTQSFMGQVMQGWSTTNMYVLQYYSSRQSI